MDSSTMTEARRATEAREVEREVERGEATDRTETLHQKTREQQVIEEIGTRNLTPEVHKTARTEAGREETGHVHHPQRAGETAVVDRQDPKIKACESKLTIPLYLEL